MIRAESRVRFAPPGCAMAVGADGLPRFSGKLTSPGLYEIRDVFQTPSDTTISIRLKVRPPTAITFLEGIRIDAGLHGTTRATHPADCDDAVMILGANPYTYAIQGSVWGDGNHVFKGGHCYVSKAALIDAGPVANEFLESLRGVGPGRMTWPTGGAYSKSETIAFLEGWDIDLSHFFLCKADYYDQPQPDGLAHLIATGGGSDTDYRNVSDCTWTGLTLYDNRPHQRYNAGWHATNLGSDIDTTVPLANIFIDRWNTFGSGGYGASYGGGNFKYNIRCIDSRWSFSDTDGAVDIKNKLNRNDCLYFIRPRVEWNAMGSQGTNLEPVVTTTTIPITVTNGSRDFTVPLSVDPTLIVGDYVNISAPTFHSVTFNTNYIVRAVGASTITFRSAGTANASATSDGLFVRWISRTKAIRTIGTIAVTTTNGSTDFTVPKITDSATQPGETVTLSGPTVAGIDLNDSFWVVATGTTTITLRTRDATTANASTTSAGTGMTFFCPHISDGDPAMDGRGPRIFYDSPTWEGEAFGRTVWRGRGGIFGFGNGEGATHLTIANPKGNDVSPSWVRETLNSGYFVSMLGKGMSTYGLKFYTTGGATGVLFGADARSCQLGDYYIEGSYVSIEVRGDNTRIGMGECRDYINSAVLVDGATAGDNVLCSDDPFTATVLLGSSPTTTNVSCPAHGKSPGTFDVAFSGAHSGNGLTVDKSTTVYTGTYVDANNFTVPLVGSATSLDAFGGSGVLARFNPSAHFVKGVVIDGLTAHLTEARDAQVEISSTSRATRYIVRNSLFISDEDEVCVIDDNGADTVWGPGNVGLPNCQQQITMLADGTGRADGGGTTLTVADSGKIVVVPSNAAALSTLVLPDQSDTGTLPEGWWIDAIVNVGTGANGLAFDVTSGTISDANNNSSSGGTITSSTTGATIRIVWRSTSGWRVLFKIGTWTLA